MDAVKNAAQGAANTAQNAGAYVTDSLKSGADKASFETNKGVAKDGSADVSTRASAAKDAVGDKVNQKGNDASAEANKKAAQN